MQYDSMTTLVTHDGKFHADDVFATAVLLIHLGKDLTDTDISLERTREKDVIASGDYVYDVGGIYNEEGNRFDHHQPGAAGKRENGITYAAFGLVWKKFGAEICGSQSIANRVDRRVVQPVDALDNGESICKPTIEGVLPYGVSGVIGSFLPTWKEEREGIDDIFESLVPFAKKILEREITWAQDQEEAILKVTEIFDNSPNKQVIELDQKYPWEEVADKYPDALYVIHPQDGKWRAHAIRKGATTFELRKPFPSEWAGLRDEELQKVTGVDDAFFCHNKLFTTAVGSEEGARKLAGLALSA
ncbi:metal-dependent hydrolase [Candidatus Wolfebacteria bacterium]|nr:MAG: metal-dependent hydrolase [Candidatus Wolfebacteria bacterium]